MHMYFFWYGRLKALVNLCKAIIGLVTFMYPFSVHPLGTNLLTFTDF